MVDSASAWAMPMLADTRDVVVAERHRRREALEHTLGDCFRLDRPAWRLLDEHGELVTAEAGDRVAGPRDARMRRATSRRSCHRPRGRARR